MLNTRSSVSSVGSGSDAASYLFAETAMSWVMHDGRGSVGQQVTATGSVTFAAFYSPYGEPSVTLGASAS
ncbi:MAG: hypothetical protein LBJ43_06040, partial [Propionibacteriaceae bacterium]|nr:hypothetical protein [Propionibacteriaceae bacterium]